MVSGLEPGDFEPETQYSASGATLGALEEFVAAPHAASERINSSAVRARIRLEPT